MAELPRPRYYLGRLWKISWSAISLGKGRVRIVKHYERRNAIGGRWQYIRGRAFERAI